MLEQLPLVRYKAKYLYTIYTPCSGLFALVDSEGNTWNNYNGQLGLLLYNGGTVCDDMFDGESGDIICRRMGYAGAMEWKGYGDYVSNRDSYQVIFSEYEIKIDAISCPDNGNWDQCTYSHDDYCVHEENVFLSCTSKIEGIC